MAVTVEELEIKITAKCQEALAGLDQVIAKVEKVAGAAMPKMQQAATATATVIKKSGADMAHQAETAAKAVERTTRAMTGTQKGTATAGKGVERSFSAAQKRLVATEEELDRVKARVDQIRQETNSSKMPDDLGDFEKYREASLENLLAQDKEYQKLIQRSEELKNQWQQQNEAVRQQQVLVQELAQQKKMQAAESKTQPAALAKPVGAAYTVPDTYGGEFQGFVNAVNKANYALEQQKQKCKSLLAEIRALQKQSAQEAVSGGAPSPETLARLDDCNAKLEQERLKLDQVATAANQAQTALSDAAGAGAGVGNDMQQPSGLLGIIGTSGRLSGVLSVLGSGLSKVGGVAKSVFGAIGTKLKSMVSQIGKGSKGLHYFGTRLRGIVSSALIFNLVSSALRKMTSYVGNAIMASNQMRTAMNNLRGAAATAASPIISALTPALAALANAAATVFSWLSRLFSLITGKSVKSMQGAAASVGGYGAAAGGAADKVKELDKATNTLGLDELNVVQQPDDSSSGGGGGGGGGAELPNYDFSGTTPFLDSLMEAIKTGDYYKVGQLFAEKINESLGAIDWAPIQATAARWASNLATILNGFVEAPNIWQTLGHTLAQSLNTALTFLDTCFQTFHWESLGTGLGNGLNTAFSELDWAGLGRLLTDKLRAALLTLHGFLRTFDWVSFGHDIATLLISAVSNINWPMAAAALSKLAVGLLTAINTALSDADWEAVGRTIWEMLAAIDWGGLLEQLVILLGQLILAIPSMLRGFFDGMAGSLDTYLHSKFDNVGQNGILGFLEGMWSILCDITTWLWDHLVKPVLDFICEAFGIHSPSTVFFDFGMNLVLGLLNGLTSIWDSITGFFSEKFGAIKKKVSDTWDSVKKNTSTVWNGIKESVGKIWDGIKEKSGTVWDNVKLGISDAWTAIKNNIRDKINSIIRFMNGLLRGAANMVNRMIDILNGFAIDVPEWAQGAVGTDRFGFNLSHVNAPQIEELAEFATGGIIKRPTLGVIGEYPGAQSNPEIVSPLNMMKGAFKEALAEQGGIGGSFTAEQPIELSLDGDVFYRAMVRIKQNRGVTIGSAFAEAY